jgi:hypothetical protein
MSGDGPSATQIGGYLKTISETPWSKGGFAS